MQVHISKSAAAAVAVTPDGLTGGAQWNFIQQRDDSASNGVYMAYFWTIRGSETSVTITPSPTTSIRAIITTIVAYVGATVDNGMPIGDYSNGYLLTNNTTGIAAPAVATGLDNTEVLLFSTSSNATDTALTTTWTNADAEILDSREWVSAQTSNFQHSAAYDVQPTATTTTTYTATPSATSAGKVAAAHVIRPQITTFPRLAAYLTDFADSNGTSTNITMPTAATGDLLLVEFQADGSQTTIGTSSSGWTKIGQYANSTVSTFALFAGIQGTAAALTITNTTSLHRAWTVRVIKNWSGTIADIEVGSTTGSGTNMNPPSLTPAAGSRNWLWGAIGVGSQNSTYPTVPPASWGNFVNVRCNSSAGSTHIGHGDAWTIAAGTSMDPPTFTSASGAWLALTVAIR
ncbi:hypothetical protein [Nocardia vulneris]|uniref:Uncharacterized protein n=1 Tax=Nocardia vulneris TaxID=1141657 RepID=A0ABR4ZDA5_9NOCA|nr:hypothetical protein [Nocardia vulneris]KIA62989.1 hypothetical protein FG87_21650 [Nocardia vulneris]